MIAIVSLLLVGITLPAAANNFDPTLTLTGLVRVEAYDRSAKLCRIFNHPAFLNGLTPNSVPYHYAIDSKFRESVNEWYRAAGRGLSASTLGDEKEKFVQLTSLFTDLLVDSEGFKEATAVCYERFPYKSEITLDDFQKLNRYALYASDMTGALAGSAATFVGVGAAFKITHAAKLFAPLVRWLGRINTNVGLAKKPWLSKALLFTGMGGAIGAYTYYKSTQHEVFTIAQASVDLGAVSNDVLAPNEVAGWENRLQSFQSIIQSFQNWNESGPRHHEELEKIMLRLDAHLPQRPLIHGKLFKLRTKDHMNQSDLNLKALLKTMDDLLILRQVELEVRQNDLLDVNTPEAQEEIWRIRLISKIQELTQHDTSNIVYYQQLNLAFRLIQRKRQNIADAFELERLNHLRTKIQL